jgi:polyferredoxin
MGIDIRQGPQLECIQCALCIDACDEIMGKVGRPPKLIAYDTFRNLDAASHGDRAPIRLIRPRTILYGCLLTIVAAVLAVALANKSVLDVNVLADRNPLYVQLTDGGLRNGYTVKLLNKSYETHSYALAVEGLPGAQLTIVSAGGEDAGHLAVAPDDLRAFKTYVTLPRGEAMRLPAGQNPLTFIVRDLADNSEIRHRIIFRGPEK